MISLLILKAMLIEEAKVAMYHYLSFVDLSQHTEGKTIGCNIGKWEF